MPSTPLSLAAPRHAPLPPQRPTHRVTTPPRFRREGGALWLGVGLCVATLLLLRATDPR